MDDDQKKTHLLTLLRLYSKDRDIDSLGHSLDVLLDTPIQRRLLPHIRFVPTEVLNSFTIILHNFLIFCDPILRLAFFQVVSYLACKIFR